MGMGKNGVWHRSSDHGTSNTSSSSMKSRVKWSSKRRESDPDREAFGNNSHHQEATSRLAAQRAYMTRVSFRESIPRSLLQSYDDRECVAPIMPKEIKIGPKLGAGEFSNVYEIQSFNLFQDHATDVKNAEELEKRLFLKKHEKYRQTKKARYAVKRLKDDYFRDHDVDACFQAVR